MDPQEAESFDAEIRKEALAKNPFPGLRPFTIDECHLYFGRENQVDEVLMKLAENQFATVLGFSGSGKSSLMYCGVIPVLLGGFMTEAGASWNIISTRPGISPIDNLAEAILENDPDYTQATEEEKLINRTVVASILRSGPNGLIDIARKYKLTTGSNLLIHLDQFEELFRYRSDEAISESHDEAALFVNSIIEAARQREVPIYVAITMRSDYIGECSIFTGLTELINESNYLIPQMTRDQLRMVIEGPVAVGGGRISERLVKRLLGDIGDGQDQLPVLQHALMRTWDYWVENRDTTEAIDIRHYNAIGRVEGALSQHANEVFDELDADQKRIAEVIFKSLTEKTSDESGSRRPATVENIAAIAGISVQELIPVIEKFREPGRSLLMPPVATELTPDTMIEISHESLMRIWTKLSQWVEEEHESAKMYLRLSDAAAMYQIGRTGLWRPPDLQLALNWQKKQRPTRHWASRYDEAFERAMVFLDTSRITYEAEQRNQELMQKRLIKRTRAVAVFLGAAAVVAIVFFIYAVTQQIEAESQRDFALQNEINALEKGIESNNNYLEASLQRLEATRNAELAEMRRVEAVNNFNEANRQRQRAEAQTRIAVAERLRADAARLEAEEARDYAQQQYQRAEENYREAQRLLYLSTAQSMSVKSLNVADDDLQGLLSQQAYVFHERYEGNEHDSYIYDGLYNALANLKGESFNTYRTGSNIAIRSITYDHTGDYVYTAGSDGRVLKWQTADLQAGPSLLARESHPARVIEASPEGNWLVVGTDSADLQIFNLQNLDQPPVDIKGHSSLILDIEFNDEFGHFFSLENDGSIRNYDFAEGQQIGRIPNAKSLAVNPDHETLTLGTLQGELINFNINSGETRTILESEEFNPIHTVEYSADGRYIAFGDERGRVNLFDTREQDVAYVLVGSTSRINSLQFSPDGTMLGAASYDGTVQIFRMDNPDALPIVMRDHNGYVWDLAFSPDSQYLMTSTSGGMVKRWPTNARILANQLCEELSRNMTPREWERYVGNNISYEETCLNIRAVQ